ncbi:hypothetical protein HCH_01494 [Hahella chejuensis KCTC 2396]|uniref:Uncharacterized protein n=1 Tax=Hahella chejuensis (strain KCTC 2396) TaxID=349521 RepID=Q2SLX2_HAHCH|nr:hypothetical protein HCH_01494 [Hahella chejuensis KCTC 2396]
MRPVQRLWQVGESKKLDQQLLGCNPGWHLEPY